MRPQQIFNWDKPKGQYEAENLSWFDQWREVEHDYDTPLGLFLNIPEHSPRSYYESREFKAIQLNDALEKIRNDSTHCSTEPAIWLHDQDVLECRDYNGVMSTKKLHQILQMKRFGLEGHPDALRRKIHIPNPNSESLGVLVHNATGSQRPGLIDFLFRHIKGQHSGAWIGASIGGGERTFSMTYHLPSFVWRDWSKDEVYVRQDHRKKTDGSPWRRSRDLSYLRGAPASNAREGRADMLHETQQSLTIMCNDKSMWTLLSLNDVYFYTPDPNNEDTIQSYEIDPSTEEPEVEYDPISLGVSVVSNMPADDPREFFFFALKIRLSQALEEWRNIQYRLQDHISTYIDNLDVTSRSPQSTLGSTRARVEAIQKSHSWLEKTNSLLTLVSRTLSGIIDAANSFMANCPNSIEVTPRIAAFHQKLQEIIKGLGEVRDGIKDVKNSCDNFRSELELHIEIQDHNSIVLQHWNVIVVQVMSPVAIAAAILQSGLLSIGPAWAWFPALIVLFFGITWSIDPSLSPLTRWYSDFTRWFYGREFTEAVANSDHLPGPTRPSVGAGLYGLNIVSQPALTSPMSTMPAVPRPPVFAKQLPRSDATDDVLIGAV